MNAESELKGKIVVSNIPAELKNIAGWVCWKHSNKDGKSKKPPCDLSGNVKDISEIPPYTLEQVISAAYNPANKIDGIGFKNKALPNGWFFGDYDDCLNSGALDSLAESFIDSINTYTETSPSGAGIRFIGIGGDFPGVKFADKSGKSFELYTAENPGYCTITGHVHILSGNTVNDCADMVNQFIANHTQSRAGNDSGTGKDSAMLSKTPASGSQGVLDGVALARENPAAVGWDSATAEKFNRLWNGDCLHNSDSQSDFAFLKMLAYLSGKNPASMRAAYESSNRLSNSSSRERWERRADSEISKAIATTEAVYTPKSVKPAKDSKNHSAEIANNAAEWQSKFLADKSGGLKNHPLNISLIIENDPAWAGVVGFNEFTGKIEKRKLPPYANAQTGEWIDFDDNAAAIWFTQEYQSAFTADTVASAVNVVSFNNKFHPVREYLSNLQWDGIARVENWLVRYLGAIADSDIYLQTIGKCWLISAVARVFKPGCKADTMLILEGEQGLGKSTALKNLAIYNEWFTDGHIDVNSKDSYLTISGKWLIEWAELDAMNRASSEGLKAFLSQSFDRYRPPYGKRMVDVPRQCIFAGSGNKSEYLKDSTGARRFWPVLCTSIDNDSLKKDAPQLWAEAVALFHAGSPWWVDSTAPFILSEQEKRFDLDSWEDEIANYLKDKDEVATADILKECIGLDVGKHDKIPQIRLRSIMDRLAKDGWQKSPGMVTAQDGSRKRGYVRL